MKVWADFCVPPAKSRPRRSAEQTNALGACDVAPSRPGCDGLSFDKSFKAPDDDQCSPSDFNDVDLARGDQFVELGLSDSEHACGDWHPNGQRIIEITVGVASVHKLGSLG